MTAMIQPLSETQAWELLATQDLGRLATTSNGRTEIYPINYVVRDRTIVIRTRPGSKLSELAIFPEVVFETDHFARSPVSAWSVIVHASAIIDPSPGAVLEVEQLGLHALLETEEDDVVVLHPYEVSARSFTGCGTPESG